MSRTTTSIVLTACSRTRRRRTIREPPGGKVPAARAGRDRAAPGPLQPDDVPNDDQPVRRGRDGETAPGRSAVDVVRLREALEAELARRQCRVRGLPPVVPALVHAD